MGPASVPAWPVESDAAAGRILGPLPVPVARSMAAPPGEPAPPPAAAEQLT